MKDRTRVFIVGAGAIGKVLAVTLVNAQKDVIIIRGSVDDTPAYIEKISVELADHTLLEAVVQISSLSNFDKLKGIVVLTNKSYGNKALAVALKKKCIGSPIVILQNGLDVEQPFIDHDFS